MKYATTGRPGAVGASATVAASTIAPSEARTTETPDNAASGSRGASAGGALRGDEAAAKAVAWGGEALSELEVYLMVHTKELNQYRRTIGGQGFGL